MQGVTTCLCRLLLFFTYLGSIYCQLPLLSGESKSSQCTIDCSEERLRPVCGSDGRTYDSRCDIDRAKCEGHPVDFKHRGKCSESGRCQAQRTLAQSQSRKYSTLGIFIPDCKEDGSYSEVQCHRSTGYCWCVDIAGKPIPGSSVRYKSPNCAYQGRRLNRRRTSRGNRQRKGCSNTDRSIFNKNLIDIFKSEYNRMPASDKHTSSLFDTEQKRVIQWKFTQLDQNEDSYLRRREVRDLRRLVKKIVRPRPCAKTFIKYCDLDQDRKISRSEWSVCLGVDINKTETTLAADSSEVASSLSWSKLPPLKGDERPSDASLENREDDLHDCLSTRRAAIEHHRQDPASGHYIPECTPDGNYQEAQCHQSTSYCWCANSRNGKPIRGTVVRGEKPDCETVRRDAKSFKGCSLKKKQRFVEEYIDFLITEMTEAAKNDTEGVMNNPVTNEQAALWKLSLLDTNQNQFLDKKEWKSFRRDWKLFRKTNKRRRKLRKCWRNFLRYCDDNEDKRISSQEWLVCMGVNKASTLPKRRGPNPFDTILKSD